MNKPPAVSHVHREPAQLKAITCPNCGAPIELHTYGSYLRVACAHCGSVLTPQDDGSLALLEKARRDRRPHAIELYWRCRFDNKMFEVVGYMQRSTTDDGDRYIWEEYLLYSPYHGYRYLTHNLWDNAWMFASPSVGMPKSKDDNGAAVPGSLWTETGLKGRPPWTHYPAAKNVALDDKSYRLFQASTATVEYVEGEFPWEVRVGDQAEICDFVAPPFGLSVELSETQDEDAGREVNVTQLQHLSAQDVAQAFAPAKKINLVREDASAMLRPNLLLGRGSSYLICGALLLAISLAWTIGRQLAHGPEHAVTTTSFPSQPVATAVAALEVNVQGDGPATDLKVRVANVGTADYNSINLVWLHRASQTVYRTEVELGPSQPEQELRLHVIPTGDYTLIATTYCEHPFQNSGVVIPTTFKLPGATECTGTFNVSATSNPAPESSGFIALLLWLLAGPAIWLLRKSTTESRRWQNSNI